ncbi:MAG: hypothetical protein J6J82_01965 [Alphaproteobacteria bacterium]|nr:hypothetical protein [Alphaproteobacteria bacterium]
MKMWVVDIRKVCAFFCAVLLPNMALAVTCPSGFSEFLIDDAHVVVPLSERCPDGYSQIYTVDDCADANTGSVCAVCDSDYILGGFANCVELCSADKKTIRFSNDSSFNLLKSPGTKPALNILTANNQQCYVDLAAGNAPGLNFQLPSGATYHAVQHGGGYRVCAPGYTLSYDCGIGGGVPPESQSLLSGYWYTVPASVGSCRVPDGMRFTGWEIDGIKHSPYTIYTYDFDTNKTLTAMFGDASKVYVNYFCETTNSSPVYTDIVMLGEGVATKTNMCPYEPKETEPLAWIEPFSQEEINQLVAMSGGDLSDFTKFGFFGPYFGMGKSTLTSEIDLFVLLLIMDAYDRCINESGYASENPDACVLSQLVFNHTYFDPVAFADVDMMGATAEMLALLFKDIVPDADVNLVPLYMPTLYEMTWNCGKYFHVSGGFDFNGSTSYGWTVRYGCSAPERGGYDYNPAYGMTFVGWNVDGVFYEGTDLTYIWTEDKTATGTFDYNLNANFDCGTDGVLTSGDATLTYSGRGAGDMYVPLNINAQCTANIGKKFVGWQIDGVDTVYNVGDTLNWVDSIVLANSDCSLDYYGEQCDKLIFTAVYEDVPAGTVNYYCSVNDSVPAFSEQLIVGNSVDVKTNMCPYDTKKTEPLAWVVPFTQDEINQIIALGESGLNLSMMESFLMPYFGQDGGLLANEVAEMMFALLLQYYAQCGNNTDATCTLSRLIYEHTYLDPNAWASDPFDEMYSWFRDIYSDTDLNVLPLYHAAGYNINFDCGKYFRPAAGDLNDIAWTARYGWDKTYYCADLNGQDYSFDVGECVDFSEGGECLQLTTAIDMVGWQIDGSEYEQTFKYIWTTDQNAVAVFDYDLSATFDCGTDGVLASGVENVTYTGRNVGTDEISLNIDATCASNVNGTFVGWKLVNNDTQYQVGDTLNWLDVFLNANNCDSYYSSCKKLTFEAVYEDILNLNYFCSVDDEIPTYVAKIKSNVGSSLRTDLCKYDTAKNKLNAWVVPFNDQEIAELDAILAGNEMPEFVKKVFIDKSIMYMDSMTEEEQLSLMIYMLYGGSDQSTGDPVIDYIARMVFEHLYLIEGDTKTQIVIDADTDIYALFAAVSYKVNFDCGDIAQVEHYMQSNSASYGQEFEIASNCLFYNNSVWSAGNLAEFIGWEIDGNMYTENDSFVWNYTTDKTLTGIYDYNLKATFDCGADGILSTGDAAVEYSGRGDGSTMIPLNITAQCVPNVGKKFVGWSLPYYSGNAIKAGSVLDWLDIVVAHDTYDIDSEVVEFTAVYEDVIDVNYYCSAVDVSPTYTDVYPVDTTSVELRSSGCDYDAQQFNFRGWYTPFTADEVATLKSYSFDTKFPEYWAVIEPTFVNHTSSYTYDYETVSMLTGLYGGYGVGGNDESVKYLTELLQKHWFLVDDSLSMTVSDSVNDVYAFFVEVD